MPGCVDGWFELRARFGRLPMAEILAPAIAYAREGFPVSELIAYYWRRGGEVLREQPGFAETFLRNGRAPRKGEIFRNPALAQTLEKIAVGGRDAFYRGEIAGRIDAFCRRVGCFLRKEDLAAHRSTWVDPVSTSYRGYGVWELPPNGQGIAVLQILNILEPHDLRALGHNSAAYLHHLIEAKKIACEDRARYYADPDFAQIPMDVLISKACADRRRKLLDPDRARRSCPAGAIGTGSGGAGGGPGGSSARAEACGSSLPSDGLGEAEGKLRDGDTVRWTWICGLHKVESGVGGVHDGIFRSGDPTGAPGTVFEVTFDETFVNDNPVPGDLWNYHCAVQVTLGMVGTVQVITCVGDLDFDGDGQVGLSDLAQLLANYGVAAGATYQDGDVDLSDLAKLLSFYGTVSGWQPVEKERRTGVARPSRP